MSELLLVVFWGSVAGALAMLLYRWTSNQQDIRDRKQQLANLRSHMRSPDLEQREIMALSMQNLRGSLSLLGRVVGPSLLSAVPVLLIASWLHTEHCCLRPAPGDAVTIRYEPKSVPVQLDTVSTLSGPGIKVVRYQSAKPLIDIEVGGVRAFQLDLRSPPIGPVSVPRWWNAGFANDGDYLDPRAAIDELTVDLQPKEFISAGPGWIRGWEFLYFVAIFVVALALKIGLKIQ
jgi:hypothetical protein